MKYLIVTFLCALAVVAEAVTPTPTPTPLSFGKVPHSTTLPADWYITGGHLVASGGGGGTPGGANTQVQFNDSGAFGGSENFTWDNASGALVIGLCQGGAQTGVNLNALNAVENEDTTVLSITCATGLGINSRNIVGQTIATVIGSGSGETVHTVEMLTLHSPVVASGSSITGDVIGLEIAQLQLSNPAGSVYGVYIYDQGNSDTRFSLYVAGGRSYIKGDLIIDAIVDEADEYSIKPNDRQLANPSNGTVLDWSGAGVTIHGTNTNDNASSGIIGEEVESLKDNAHTVSLTTNTAADVTSISLTAGDWDVEGNVNFTETTSTVTARSAGISTTSATLPTDGSEAYCGVQSTVTSETNSITLPRKRISIAATTTVYLVGKAVFSAGTCAGFGGITARRAR